MNEKKLKDSSAFFHFVTLNPNLTILIDMIVHIWRLKLSILFQMELSWEQLYAFLFSESVYRCLEKKMFFSLSHLILPTVINNLHNIL